MELRCRWYGSAGVATWRRTMAADDMGEGCGSGSTRDARWRRRRRAGGPSTTYDCLNSRHSTTF